MCLQGGNPGELKVMLDSASLTKGGKAIASNVQLKKVDGAGSLYQLDFMALKPSAGWIDNVTYTSIRLCYFKQCCGSMTYWCGSGSGSGSADPCL